MNKFYVYFHFLVLTEALGRLIEAVRKSKSNDTNSIENQNDIAKAAGNNTKGNVIIEKLIETLSTASFDNTNSTENQNNQNNTKENITVGDVKQNEEEASLNINIGSGKSASIVGNGNSIGSAAVLNGVNIVGNGIHI